MSTTRQNEQPRHWILRSKLEMPRKNAQFVIREDLLAKLDGWLDLSLGVVIAPAGYAKSSTVAEWCRRQLDLGTTVAWLSLDESDREPAQFLSYVIATLAAAGVATHGLAAGAEEGFFAGGLTTASAELLEAISSLKSAVILVLDDYHRVNSPKVDALLRGMLASAPPNLTVIASTRSQLPFDIGALLAAGQAAELTSEALRFSRDELASIFHPATDTETLTLLYERTEGWPVAVQLARLVVTDAPTKEHFEKFHGHSGHIATYLAEQIVNGLPEELQDFLCLTSVVERFNASLADAIHDKPGSETLLEKLEPLNALVIRAEGNDSTYRYHHLFAEYLQKELRRRHGDGGVKQVHHRASLWFEDNGFMAEAVRHSRESQDYDRCASLVERAGGWELILFGGIGYLRDLLQHIPDDVAKQYPRILLAKAYLGVKDGLLVESRALFDTAANAREHKDMGRLQRDILNVGALIVVYEDAPISIDQIGRLQSRLAGISPEDPLTKSILACQLIVCQLAVGQFAYAEQLAQATMRSMREAQTVLGLNYCYLHAGLAALYQGRLKAAEAHFGVGRRMAEENFAHDPGLRALSRLLTGALHHWTGEQSNYSDEQARADLGQVEIYDGWFDIFAAGVVVEAYGLKRPREAVSRARRIAERRGLPRLSRIADAVQIGLADDPGRGTRSAKLAQQLPKAIWRDQPFWWSPYLESRLALGLYYAGIDRSRAIDSMNEAAECAEHFGANLYLVRILIARALLHDLSGQRAKAVDDLTEALSLAAPENMVGPFFEKKGMVPLLRAVIRHAQEAYIDILVIEFAGSLISRSSRFGDSGEEDANVAGLSIREREVLDELANGRSNKEIARLLDMTEHTVKFHLKNIFVKLGAERRTEAVANAKRLRLV